MKKILLISVLTLILISCSTTKELSENTENNSITEKSINKIEEIPEPAETENLDIEEEIDIEAPLIKIVPEIQTGPALTGSAAVTQNLKDKRVEPKYIEGKLRGFKYQEGNVYEIHCQTYHSTLIQFEPGEKLIEVPYLSETEVWRISRGVGNTQGERTEFLMIKPDYSGLESTLIVITDRRVYQMEIKSFKDHYMPTVKWIYPRQIENLESLISEKKENSIAQSIMNISVEDMEYVSFDYSISYKWFRKKPVWKPVQVYDNGKFTYIILDKKCLHTEMPAVFINKKQITNSEYHKNVIVINQLIKKVTLRLGKDKVTITKN